MEEKQEGLDQPKGQRRPPLRDVNGFVLLQPIYSEDLIVPPILHSALRNGRFITIEIARFTIDDCRQH